MKKSELEQIASDDKYKIFRRLCLDLQYEARRLCLTKDLIVYGVAWNFNHAYTEKIKRLLEVND